jgi:hypothetical protein
VTPPLKFLFDECIGLPIMQCLELAVSGTYQFEHLCEKFSSGALDNEWIPDLAKEGGWVVITGDGGRNSNKGGKLPELCLHYKVTCLILSPKFAQRKTADKLGALLSRWDHIVELHSKPAGSQFQLRFRESEKGTLSTAVVLLRNG